MPQTPRLEVGDTAPAFSLPDADGNTVKLSDYKGRKVIVYFYPAASTPGCTKEACDFRDNLAELNTQMPPNAALASKSASQLLRHRASMLGVESPLTGLGAT